LFYYKKKEKTKNVNITRGTNCRLYILYGITGFIYNPYLLGWEGDKMGLRITTHATGGSHLRRG
jgi:hypothetical protein